MGERGMQLKSDGSKQSWESSEYPLTCETCLGDSPYVRMTRSPHAVACKICEKPFTVFRWKAGSKGRFKSTVICQTCAKMKNVCQTCIFDLQYGLPVQLRDRVLEQHGSSGAVVAVPQSDANREWYAAQHAIAVGQGTAGVANEEANKALMAMARMAPQYERNLPKVCSFFGKGECNRGDRCPFRHEMPKEGSGGNMDESIRNRFYGKNDDVAGRMLERDGRRNEERIKAPLDKAVMTLWIGGLENSNATEGDVREKFAQYGDLLGVRMGKDGACGFVEFANRRAAELACTSSQELDINGVRCVVGWARPRGVVGGNGNVNGNGNGNAGVARNTVGPMAQPPPPPPPPTDVDTHIDESLNSITTTQPQTQPQKQQQQQQQQEPQKPTIAMPPAPAGFVAFKPSPAVAAAAAAAAKAGGAGLAMMRPPGAGGGAIKRIAIGRRVNSAPAPYYPSTDKDRLGSGGKD